MILPGLVLYYSVINSQVKFILPSCKTKVGIGGKWQKTLRSPKSSASSINNLKRIALRGISFDVKIPTINQNYRNECKERNRIT